MGCEVKGTRMGLLALKGGGSEHPTLFLRIASAHRTSGFGTLPFQDKLSEASLFYSRPYGERASFVLPTNGRLLVLADPWAYRFDLNLRP